MTNAWQYGKRKNTSGERSPYENPIVCLEGKSKKILRGRKFLVGFTLRKRSSGTSGVEFQVWAKAGVHGERKLSLKRPDQTSKRIPQPHRT